MLKILLKVKYIIEKIIKSKWWVIIFIWVIAFVFGTIAIVLFIPYLFIPIAIMGLLHRENPVKYFINEMEGGILYDLLVKYPYINEVLKLKKLMEEKEDEI